MKKEYLELQQVSTHNLKGFNLQIPLNSLVVITGPSGSGKSSLAIDTIAEEGKSRLLKVLNYDKEFYVTTSYQAMFSSSIPPVFALAQGVRNWFPYKTVGEFLGLVKVLEVLFLLEGEVFCASCGAFNRVHSISQVISWYETLKEGTKFYFLVPLLEITPKAIEYLVSQGFVKYLIDDREIDLSEEQLPQSFNEVFLILDRMVKEGNGRDRLVENIRISFSLSNGRFFLKTTEGLQAQFSLRPVCFRCGSILPVGWFYCKTCGGRGYKQKVACETCNGLKLREEVLKSRIGDFSIEEILRLDLKTFKDFLSRFSKIKGLETFIKFLLYKLEQAEFLGIAYLSPSTPVFKLSVGEKKLIEVLQVLTADLTHCLFILDEPTLGLEVEQRFKVLEFLKNLVKKGNSLLVVEHDPFFIYQADFIIELGVGGGEKGGYLVKADFNPLYFEKNRTLTSDYFSGEKRIVKKEKTREAEMLDLSLSLGRVKILSNRINLIYGRPGSGKTKVFNQLFEFLVNQDKQVVFSDLSVFRKKEDWVIQYLNLWDLLREVLVQLPSARVKGLSKKHFSFTSKEGVCVGCKGKGKKIYKEETAIEVLCEECLGKRLSLEVLNLEYKGFKIFEVLDFTIEEAFQVFSNLPKVKEKLMHLIDIGLGYLKLSQEVQTLSGGEKSRLSLIKNLTEKKQVEYVFLEFPFEGLHLEDINRLYQWIEKMVAKPVTFIILETNPLAVFLADFLTEVQNQKIIFQGFFEDWLKAQPETLKEKFAFYQRFVAKF
ncbi:hypothetical protein [Thermodesulfobacterium thermophilum]|uniref:hypothetical protein n=1 Tax=Thermodesulfobacterium thermophilum TaxID=886 RepID=UPI0003B7A140|nr:hypothetical protein [Thermodesulfobacterium thermophilum]